MKISPVAMTVAGSDSSGGAGIQADLRAFCYFNVIGTSVVTAVTAQNPDGISAVSPIDPGMVIRQLESVLSVYDVQAVKTGMLYGAETVRAVARVLSAHQSVPLVVDPVMRATSGGDLLTPAGIQELENSLFQQADIITPNLREAEKLCNRGLSRLSRVADAALELADRYGAVIVLKGGHLDSRTDAVDVVSDGRSVWQMSSPRAPSRSSHGTGCSFSAAITASLALGDPARRALRRAKAYTLGQLRNCDRAGADAWVMGVPERLPLEDVTIEQFQCPGC